MDERESLLVVEDDEATAGFLADNLAADGYRLAAATAWGRPCGRSRCAARRSWSWT